MSAILHLLNDTPINWFSKRQGSVEAETYESEYMAARLAIHQILDLRTTLGYMGIPIDCKAWLFGDNESVIKSSIIPVSTLGKGHNALSYQTVRAAIAAGILSFQHIPGEDNIADIMTKILF